MEDSYTVGWIDVTGVSYTVQLSSAQARAIGYRPSSQLSHTQQGASAVSTSAAGTSHQQEGDDPALSHARASVDHFRKFDKTETTKNERLVAHMKHLERLSTKKSLKPEMRDTNHAVTDTLTAEFEEFHRLSGPTTTDPEGFRGKLMEHLNALNEEVGEGPSALDKYSTP